MEKMLSALTINKQCCSHQAITGLHITSHHSLPHTGCPQSNDQTLQPPQRCTQRRLRMKKQRPLALDSWGTYQRSDFSEFRCLNLPIHRKVLNCLTWNVWFSLIHSNLLMFWFYLVFAYSYISWILTWLFRAVPYSYQRGCILGLSPLFCLLSKT